MQPPQRLLLLSQQGQGRSQGCPSRSRFSRTATSWRLISLVLRDSFMLTSNISDQRTLFLLLGGVGAADLLHDFWAQPGDLLSLRRANDCRDLKKKNKNIKNKCGEPTLQKYYRIIHPPPNPSSSWLVQGRKTHPDTFPQIKEHFNQAAEKGQSLARLSMPLSLC